MTNGTRNTDLLSNYHLSQLATEPFFNICHINRVCQLRAIPNYRDNPHYHNIHSLHCVHYDKMTDEVKEILVEELAELFDRWVTMNTASNVIKLTHFTHKLHTIM
jgi:hypothetical protein